MSLADAALEVGEFLLKHADLVDEVRKALTAGAPKEMVLQAIRSVQVKVSDDAIREELEEAEKRRA